MNHFKTAYLESYHSAIIQLSNPFMKGSKGSIPFEARRLGLNVLASDLNLISYLLRKVAVKLIPDLWEGKKEVSLVKDTKTSILDDFDKWSKWLYEKAKQDLEPYFDKTALNYLWVKTCHCKSCGNEIPLLSMKISTKKTIL